MYINKMSLKILDYNIIKFRIEIEESVNFFVLS